MNRHGLTVTEIIIAVVILSVGLLGLASAGATLTRMVARDRGNVAAADFAQRTLDSVRSLDWCAGSPARSGGNVLQAGNRTVAKGVIHASPLGADGWTILDSVTTPATVFVAETGISCRF